ncbi:hypothetical protein [Neotamlana laminarinivorans]|uniref:Antitoxin component YwqK of YwqJK toxin-antitoxin module n=1 Tax=Neotamlana laminarinivorans TaxID=2883124 RepID=A0A9X1L2S0_9FLAO|nr:hypothetical protein [Tamlana laminarinivorans]MCB4800130.1 hypothetical protein [Tamlana laminarinivorans]
MTKFRNLLTLIALLIFNELISQEIIGMKEVYIENKLVYKIATDELFTGIAQSKRKNGHLVYDEEYKKGIILLSNLYYNGKKRRVYNKTIYNPNKPLVLSKEIKYHLDGEMFETTTYNKKGVKILYEQFTNGKVSYSCQYFGKKKHGLELGYRDGGEKITFRCEYINGKKNGTEYCLKEDGTETKKQYKFGKKIK